MHAFWKWGNMKAAGKTNNRQNLGNCAGEKKNHKTEFATALIALYDH